MWRVMTAWRLIVGPPGTGKTTALLRVLREELDRGVPPDRIAFWSFTRAARLEALGRVHVELGLSEDDMPWLRTVHSTAYRLLHVRPERLMLDERWQEFGKKHGYTLSSIYAEDLAEPPRRTDADTMRYVLGWGRCRRYDVATTHNRSRIAVHGALFRLFWERYEEFKRAHDLLDFSDIVEDVIARERRPDINVALIDEAQDLSPLEIAAIPIKRSTRSRERRPTGCSGSRTARCRRRTSRRATASRGARTR
jgi:superfamily I DNA/RNA helicase